ncbi:MAG: hypothetical protein ACRBCS_15535 [Cellvibrionaceae bacterium]
MKCFNKIKSLQSLFVLFFLIFGVSACSEKQSESTSTVEEVISTDKVDMAECDRKCISSKVNNYVNGLVEHKVPADLLAPDIRVTENGVDVKPGEGVWKTITKQGGYQQVFIDSSLNEAVFFGAFKEQEDSLLLAVRLKFTDGKISEAEHLLSRPDTRNRLIYRHSLIEPNPVYEEAVENPLSREELVRIGHAYFDGIANSTDEGVPMDPYCNRRENGVLLLKNKNPEAEPCPIGFHRFNYITDVRDRRVAVVDEERGLVLIWGYFDIPGDVDVAPGPWGPSDIDSPNGEPRVDTRKIPRSLYIAELFKVVDGGNIRDIEAIMFNLDLGAKSGWE